MPDPSERQVRRRGRVPAVVLAATVAFGALAGSWSVLAPLGEAPDEPAHLALVLHLADGNGYPEYDGLTNQAAIIRLCKTYASATRACPRDGEEVTPTSMRLHPRADAPDKGSRPAWDDEGGDASVGQLNQMPQHPPLYYQAMAAVLRVERAVLGGPMSADRELALLRLVNALLIAPLPLLAWWAARRFRLGETAAVTAAVAVFAVPMLTHIGSTLNNDNLLTLFVAGGTALLAGVLRGDRSLRTAAALGVLTALALLSKAFGIVLIPAIVVAYLLGSRERTAPADPTGPNFVGENDDPVGLTYEVRLGWGERVRSLVAPLGLAGGVVAVLAGWWFIGVRLRTGSFAPTIESDRLTSALAPPGFSPDPLQFLGEYLRNVNNRFWGSFGWYTIRFPTVLATVATLVVLGLVVAALVPKRDATGSGRLQRTALLVPAILLGGLVLTRAWSLYATTSKFQFLQGRYLFAGLIGLVVLAALGLQRLVGRWAPLVAAGFAALLQLEAIRRCLAGWWGGPGLGPRGQLRAMVAWSAWPGELIVVLGVVVVAAGAWFVALLVRGALQPPEDRPVGSLPT